MTVLRSLRRSVAHHRMALGRYSHVNKDQKIQKRDAFGCQYVEKNPSFFSQHWYDYLQKTKQGPFEFGNKKNKRNNHKVA